MNDDHLRLSDAERDLAAADLGEHFAEGRLSSEEHGERLDAIWSARTRGEIPPIFRDLPSRYAAPVVRPAPTQAPGYWRSGPRAFVGRLPTPLLVVLIVLATIAVLSHLPIVLIGLLVWFFVRTKHRRRQAAYAHRVQHW